MRVGREDDHTPPTSDEIKKTCIITPLCIRLNGAVLNYLITGATLNLPDFTGRAAPFRVHKLDMCGMRVLRM
jgi:hypothetical protein